MRIFLYSLRTATKNLWHEKRINFLTVLTIAVGLFILGTFTLITLNMDTVLKRWSSGFGLVVYVAEDIAPETENSLKLFFKKNPDISEITYISKEDAVKELEQMLGTMSPILDGFEENPFLPSYVLKLRRESMEPFQIERMASGIKRIDGVEDVQYGKKWLSSLHTLTNGMKITALLIGSVIFIAIAFTTYSTIKILFYKRVDEIETLKLLGATRSFIRLPFLFEGLFIGTAGGLVSFIGLFSLYSFTATRLIQFMPAVKGILVFFPLETYPVIPLAGAVMSFIGSFLAVGKIKY